MDIDNITSAVFDPMENRTDSYQAMRRIARAVEAEMAGSLENDIDKEVGRRIADYIRATPDVRDAVFDNFMKAVSWWGIGTAVRISRD